MSTELNASRNSEFVVVLPADLIFAARIRSAAEAVSVSVILAKDVEEFLTKVQEIHPRLAIIDLDRRGLAVEHVVTEVKQYDVPLLAYGSHVRADVLNAARDAGADRVMARGAFAKQLSELLKR